jgi:hypothetical protein
VVQKIDIPVTGDTSGLKQKLADIGRQIGELNKVKWNPVDAEKLDRDLGRIRRRMTAMAAGPGPPQPQGDNEHPAPRRPQHFTPGQFRQRHRYAIAPEFSDVPRSFFGGMGGGVGQIAGYGMRGARLGAATPAEGEAAGGAGGAMMGLLKGAGIGALVYGAMKVGQGVSQGYDMAKERAGTLDTLTRQRGDLGVSFERLKQVSTEVAYGLGLNSKEFAELELAMNRTSRGFYKSPAALMEATTAASGLARSYGLDPSQTVPLMGGMQGLDRRQNNRELALMIGETVEKSGMSSRADEMMQTIMQFAATTSRMSLSSPNIGAFGGAFSDLMNTGVSGMTPEAAAAILGQANTSMMGMGSAGEAGQAATLAAMQHSGVGMNPLEASIMAGGGIFGTRASTFGAGSIESEVLGSRADKLAGGKDAGKTNFELMREQFGRMGGGVEFQQEMMQRYFGLSTPQQAGALMRLSGSDLTGFASVLKSAGVDPTKINTESIQTVSKIANTKMGTAGTRDQLEGLYGDLKKQGNLTKEDTDSIDAASGPGHTDEEFRNAMVKAASTKDVADNQYRVMQDSQKLLEDIEINTGDKLLTAVAGISDTIVTAMGGRQKFEDQQKKDADYTFNETMSNVPKLHKDPKTGYWTDRDWDHSDPRYVRASEARTLAYDHANGTSNSLTPYEIHVKITKPDGSKDEHKIALPITAKPGQPRATGIHTSGPPE